MLRAFWENFGENFRRERPKIVLSRSRKTRMKPSKTGKPLPKSQLDFESFSLRPLRYISVFILEYNNSTKKGGGQVKIAAKRPSYKESIDTYMLT